MQRLHDRPCSEDVQHINQQQSHLCNFTGCARWATLLRSRGLRLPEQVASKLGRVPAAEGASRTPEPAAADTQNLSMAQNSSRRQCQLVKSSQEANLGRTAPQSRGSSCRAWRASTGSWRKNGLQAVQAIAMSCLPQSGFVCKRCTELPKPLEHCSRSHHLGKQTDLRVEPNSFENGFLGSALSLTRPPALLSTRR